MGDYDKIFKENIEAVFVPLLEKMLGLTIKESFEIKDKIQSTLEREPDFLKRIIDGAGREFILQLEFQTKNDAEMVYRMAEYQAVIQRKYQMPVRQLVIYLGDSKPSMRTSLTEDEQITGFVLKNIHDLPVSATLESDIPEEIVVSILADYPKAEAGKVLDLIIKKLQQAAKHETTLRRAIQQLLVLARLRNLDEELEKKINQMPITYDITKDRLFNKGIEEGREEGREEGKEENKQRMITKAIQLGVLTVEQIAEMAEVTVEYVMSVKSKLD